ncbi:trans-aconitate 2-methyltransferase [Niveibacterium sp. SC-1]|uniref:trans-aconitate 2-methyltransferase n=1 Tax=Niveibacterium sp. SC-1 TaxID=3135646 RepID=UPI00311F39B2
MSWSASQYGKFEDERNRPIRDLLAQIPLDSPRCVVDLGCGPGNSTELLLQRFPAADVIGVDNAPDMLAAARKRLPQLRFESADIASWAAPSRVDLLFANASLQWVPDHARLMPALLAQLAPGGCLAVQMPDNLDEPAHRLMREIAAEAPWADTLREAVRAREARHDAPWYYRHLQAAGGQVNIWRTVFHHPLAGGATAVVEWFKGSGLRPFLDPLDEALRARFLQRYTAAVAEAYPALPDGSVLLPFPRLFFVATLHASAS